MILKRVKLKVTIKAGKALFQRGAQYASPNIPKPVLQEVGRRPELFVCEYAQDAPGRQPVLNLSGSALPPTPETTQDAHAFINEWLRIREYPKDDERSFYAYVMNNRSRFKEFMAVDDRVNRAFVRKWRKFYPDEEMGV